MCAHSRVFIMHGCVFVCVFARALEFMCVFFYVRVPYMSLCITVFAGVYEYS